MPWMVLGVLFGVWYGKDLPEADFKQGMAILILLSVGLMLFGLFSLVEARYRIIPNADLRPGH